MNIVVHNNISSKLKNPASEIGYYSYTNRWQTFKESQMIHFKKILIMGFSLFISSVSFGQVLNYKATSRSCKVLVETTNKWTNWDELKTTSVLFVLNTDKDRITLYVNQRKTIYNIIGYKDRYTDSEGDYIWIFNCKKNGSLCQFRLVQLNSQNESLQLYLDFYNMSCMYNIHIMD